MSVLPLLYSSWWEGLNRPHYLRDQGFGMGLRPDLTQRQLMDRYYAPLRNRDIPESYYKSSFDPLRSDVSGFSTITDDKNVFQVLLDVHLFKPDEIKVKLVDKFVVVEAKHMERQDEHGFVTRQFARKYVVPDVVDTDLIKAELFADGILVIMAPVKDVKENEVEKVINIERTGKTFLDTRMIDGTQNFPIGTDRYKDKVVHNTDIDQGLTPGTTPDTTCTTGTTGTTTGTTTPTTTDTTTCTTTGTITPTTTDTTTCTTTGITTPTTTGTLDTMKKLNESKKDSEDIMKDKRRELDEMMEARRGECMKLAEEKKTMYENLMENKKKNERVENKLKLDEKKRDERKKF